MEGNQHSLVGVWKIDNETYVIADKAFLYKFKCTVIDGVIRSVFTFKNEGKRKNFNVDLPISLERFINSFSLMLRRMYKPLLPPTRLKLDIMWREMNASRFILFFDPITNVEDFMENEISPDIKKNKMKIECSYLYLKLFKRLKTFKPFIFDHKYDRFLVSEFGLYSVRFFKNILSFSLKTEILNTLKPNEFIFDSENMEYVSNLSTPNIELIELEEV